jgi:hypothetical protein
MTGRVLAEYGDNRPLEVEMKRRLILIAAVAVGLSMQFTPAARASANECYFESYGSGQCGLTCVSRNDQGSVTEWETWFFVCGW